ncbi:MAG: hypothetical protein ACRCTE_05045 [Cellulosilyticaceae bacterium]
MTNNMGMWGLIAFLYVLARRSHTSIGGLSREEQNQVDANGYKTFSSDYYDVSFKYPADWVKDPHYKERYGGESGYFELSEIETFGKTLDEVVKQEVKGTFKPYGNNPTIEKVMLDGEEGRLIIPSGDQAACFDKETALIVRNKKPVVLNGEKYDYLVIWADQNHMDEIIASFKFL